MHAHTHTCMRTHICTRVPFASVADDDNVNHWEMVLKFLFECCNPEAPQMYEVALNIIRWGVIEVGLLSWFRHETRGGSLHTSFDC